MIDTHEKEEVVKTRVKYLKQFFTDELCEPCWITFYKTEFVKLIQENEILKSKVDALVKTGYQKDNLCWVNNQSILLWAFDGVTTCCTKTEGIGVMISTFASREFGIRFSLRPGEKLSQYTATDALGSIKKPPLKTDPCYQEFLY